MSTTSIDTAVLNPIESSVASSDLLGSVYGSVAPAHWGNKQISKYYDLAQASFSNRQFQEAYQTLETLISPISSGPYDLIDGRLAKPSPIITAKSSLRVKIWVLYFKLLDAIIGLSPDENVEGIAPKERYQLIFQVKNGTIWDRILQDGYGGVHARVEAEVAWHLGQLVYLHAADQKDNQYHLETYLSTSSQVQSNPLGSSRELRFQRSVIHLLATSVLPRNGEWDYARTLIDHSELLTEEERGMVRQQLNDVEELSKGKQDAKQENGDSGRLPVEPTKVTGAWQHQQAKGASHQQEANEEAEVPTVLSKPPHHRHDSEKDFGIEDSRSSALPPQPTPKSSLKPSSRPLRPQHPGSSPIKPSKQPAASPSILKRGAALMDNLQRLITSLSHSAFRNPMALLRFILFLIGIVVALSRRDVKERLRQAWEKVQRTVGMGVKVSYI